MKKITYLLLMITSLCFSQVEEFKADHSVVEAEMKSAAKKMNFKVNPNTQNYDLTYGKLEFTVDPAIYNVLGKVTFTFKALADMNTVTFDLTNQLSVSSVKKGTSNLSFIQNANNELVITLPSILTAGNSETIEINYNGAPASGQQAFTVSTHGSPSVPVLYTLSEPYGARDWWPCKQDLNDKIDSVDIYITAPAQYLSASNGVEMSRNVIGQSATTFFKHNYPIPAYLIAIAVTNYKKKNTGTAGLTTTFPIVDYIYPESDTPANTVNLGRTSPIINFYESKIGPYPYNTEKYGHTQWGWSGGMEHATNSFMINYSRGLLSHELAHQWFGDKITCGTWKDIWLNEGITEYMSGCVVENFDGATSFVNWKTTKINSITSYSGSDSNLYLTDAQLTNVNRIFSSQITYNKGSMVTHMLRYIMGDANFFLALKNYLNDPLLAYKYATTSQFQAHLEIVYGNSLQEFFNDWVYGKGFPKYTITASNSATAKGVNKVLIEVNQTQSDASVSFFELPLPVKITLTDGSVQNEQLNNTFDGQVFEITTPLQATSVSFNDNKDLIVSSQSSVALDTIDFELSRVTLLYPNPSNDKITIQLPSSVVLKKVNFINALGQKVLYVDEDFVDVSNLAVGIYQVTIETSEGIAHKKFIKK